MGGRMMERLTERLHDGCYGVAGCGYGCKHVGFYCKDPTRCPSVTACFDKLGRYEDLEEAGRLNINQYSPGEWVYCLEKDEDGWECNGYIFLGKCKDYVMVCPCESDDIDQQLHILERNSTYFENDIKVIHKDNAFMTQEAAHEEMEMRKP